MGYDAACTIRIEGQTGRGTACLEHKDLVFKGPFRVAVPLSEITAITADRGTLVVRFGGRRAEFEIGDAAQRWARRIANPPSRLDKLGIKPGMRVALVNLPDAAFRQEIAKTGATVSARATTGMDAIFLGADRPADLARLGALAARVQPAGAVWVVRRKGRTAVSERDSMAAGKEAGLVDVKVVSFSDTHTAEKYVIPVAKRGAPARSSLPAPRTPRSSSSRVRS